MKLYKYLLILALLLASTQANAQPVMTFTRIVSNWPTIELYFTTACEGEPAYFTDKGNLTVLEDGVAVPDFTLWCPDLIHRYAAAFALALDARGNISGATKDSIIQIAQTFLTKMTDSTDEAAVIYCGDTARIRQPMTQNISLVKAAVDSLPASSSAALWDGVLAGLTEIEEHSTYPIRVAVLISNGNDDASIHTLSDVISYANQNRIRVFVLAPDSTPNPELDSLARFTGGAIYYAPTRLNVLAAFREITRTFDAPQSCLITYPAVCTDGSLRTVEIQLNDFCAGSDTASRTYRAPLDTSQVDRLYLSIDDVEMGYGSARTIPVRYHAPEAVTIGPVEFSFKFGSNLVETASLNTAGTALENTSITVVKSDSEFTVAINDPVTLHGSGTLIDMDVRTKDITMDYQANLGFAYWRNDSNVCLYTGLDGGSISIPGDGIGSYAPALARSFSIAPNPTTGAFEVALEFDAPTAISMRIVNTLGQTMYSEAVGEKRVTFRKSIALDHVPPGVYFFLLEGIGRYDYRKLVLRP